MNFKEIVSYIEERKSEIQLTLEEEQDIAAMAGAHAGVAAAPLISPTWGAPITGESMGRLGLHESLHDSSASPSGTFVAPPCNSSAFAFRPTVDDANIDEHASIASIMGGLNTVTERLNSMSHDEHQGGRKSSKNIAMSGLGGSGVVELAKTSLDMYAQVATRSESVSPIKLARQGSSMRTANAHGYNNNPSTQHEMKKRLRFKLDKAAAKKERKERRGSSRERERAERESRDVQQADQDTSGWNYNDYHHAYGYDPSQYYGQWQGYNNDGHAYPQHPPQPPQPLHPSQRDPNSQYYREYPQALGALDYSWNAPNIAYYNTPGHYEINEDYDEEGSDEGSEDEEGSGSEEDGSRSGSEAGSGESEYSGSEAASGSEGEGSEYSEHERGDELDSYSDGGQFEEIDLNRSVDSALANANNIVRQRNGKNKDKEPTQQPGANSVAQDS